MAYARAEIDVELITDPMLAAVGWSWLTDALEAHGASYTAASGTVTRVATESFGGMADDSTSAQLELRASWTPGRHRRGPRGRPGRRPPRGGLGRAAVHRRRPAARAGGCRGHPEPPRPARLGDLMSDETDHPRRAARRARAARGARARPCSRCATACRRSPTPPPRLREACAAIAAGTGPVAIDAERASGYRYSNRAYLIQLRREGSSTWLVDPIAFDSLAPLAEALAGDRVDPARGHPGPAVPGRRRPAPHRAVRHRARRAAAGLPARRPGHPRRDRAGPADEEGALRLRLVDAARCPSRGWSTPPSTSRSSSSCATRWPPSSTRRASASGRDQEFEHLLDFAPTPRVDAWRRTSGMHRVRGRRGLGAVRALWEARDSLAERRDVTPGRIIPDSAIVAAAQAMPLDRDALLRHQGLPRSRCRAVRRPLGRRAARGRRPRRGRPADPLPPAPTARPCRARGPTATRSPPAGWCWPARRWASSPRSRTCRSRTC